VRVSPLGFGGAPIGNLYAPVPETDAQAALHAALERWHPLFLIPRPSTGTDLAEERMGVRWPGTPRDAFAVSTKVGRLHRA